MTGRQCDYHHHPPLYHPHKYFSISTINTTAMRNKKKNPAVRQQKQKVQNTRRGEYRSHFFRDIRSPFFMNNCCSRTRTKGLETRPGNTYGVTEFQIWILSISSTRVMHAYGHDKSSVIVAKTATPPARNSQLTKKQILPPSAKECNFRI